MYGLLRNEYGTTYEQEKIIFFGEPEGRQETNQSEGKKTEGKSTRSYEYI